MRNSGGVSSFPIVTPGIGRAAFPALLMERGLITRADLAVAQQHADRQNLELAEAFVARSSATTAPA